MYRSKVIRRRIAPPKANPIWEVKFRPCATGIAIDIALANYPVKGSLFFNLHRVSYLIPWEQIDAWSKAPRAKLITIKTKPKSK